MLQDSSSITQPLLSQLQRDMLHEAHPSNSTTSDSTSAPREKFTCIIARDFEPRLEAHKCARSSPPQSVWPPMEQPIIAQ